MSEKIYKPKQYRLRSMPEDVYKIILKEQLLHRLQYNCVFSIESTIYKLIRKSQKQNTAEG